MQRALMETEVQEIKFENENVVGSHFDIVRYEDILKKKPKDHSQFDHHKLSFYALVLFTESTGAYSHNFIDYTFEEGSMFAVRKDSVHKFYNNDGKGLLLVFTENYISEQLNKAELSKLFLLFNELLSSPKIQLDETTYSEIQPLIGLIKEEYTHVNDEFSITIIKNLLQSIFSKLLRVKLSSDFLLKNNKHLLRFLSFQKLVEQNCFDSRKVTYYADIMCITTKTLNNICHSIIQKSAKAFITETLIIHIKRQIISSDKTLSEISFEVGFDEPTNFFKFFSKYAGMSPAHFRREY